MQNVIQDNEALARHLGGDLRRIAEIAGLETALKIGLLMGGSSLYIQDLGSITRSIRDERMFRARQRGKPIRLIASAFDISERRAAAILRAPHTPPEPRLVALMEKVETEIEKTRITERIWEEGGIGD